MFETLARMMTSPTDTLKLRCGACGHRAELTQSQAFLAFGPDAAPFEVRRKVKCGACGERERLGVSI